MKKSIHPKYIKTQVTCSCGSNLEIGGTKKSISLDVCPDCHPFFTGQDRLLDTEGRVEKFNKKFKLS